MYIKWLLFTKLCNQALKDYGNFLKLFDRNPLDIKTKISLFDAVAVPIILYGAEIWGVYTYRDIDNSHYIC